MNLQQELDKLEKKRLKIIAEHEATTALMETLEEMDINTQDIKNTYFSQWAQSKGLDLFTITFNQVSTMAEATAIMDKFELAQLYEKKGTFFSIQPHDLNPKNYYRSITPLHFNYIVAQSLMSGDTGRPTAVDAIYEKTPYNGLKEVKFSRKTKNKVYGYDTRIVFHTHVNGSSCKIVIPISFKFHWNQKDSFRATSVNQDTKKRWYTL